MSSTTIPRATRHHSQPATASESRPTTARHDPCATTLRSEKITDGHLQRLAIVYVRQSTQQQVLEHRESTARQYALADRAVALGWPAASGSAVLAGTVLSETTKGARSPRFRWSDPALE